MLAPKIGAARASENAAAGRPFDEAESEQIWFVHLLHSIFVLIKCRRECSDAGRAAAEAFLDGFEIPSIVFREAESVDAEKFARLIAQRRRQLLIMDFRIVANALQGRIRDALRRATSRRHLLDDFLRRGKAEYFCGTADDRADVLVRIEVELINAAAESRTQRARKGRDACRRSDKREARKG